MQAIFKMHLQVALAGPEVPEAPRRNEDKMHHLQMNICFYIYVFLNVKIPQKHTTKMM